MPDRVVSSLAHYGAGRHGIGRPIAAQPSATRSVNWAERRSGVRCRARNQSPSPSRDRDVCFRRLDGRCLGAIPAGEQRFQQRVAPAAPANAGTDAGAMADEGTGVGAGAGRDAAGSKASDPDRQEAEASRGRAGPVAAGQRPSQTVAIATSAPATPATPAEQRKALRTAEADLSPDGKLILAALSEKIDRIAPSQPLPATRGSLPCSTGSPMKVSVSCISACSAPDLGSTTGQRRMTATKRCLPLSMPVTLLPPNRLRVRMSSTPAQSFRPASSGTINLSID